MLSAPWEPPLTSRVGPVAGSPNAVRAAAASAARSRSAIARRSGRPMQVACGSGVCGKEVNTCRVSRAASLLASPGSTFCSWMTMGSPSRRAARYAGVAT